MIHLPKLRLQPKLLILFILISAIPLFIGNIIWLQSSQNQILLSSSGRIENTLSDLAHTIETYLQTKQTGLIIHSQTDAILTADKTRATAELQNFLLQDEDITELTLIGQNGKEVIHITRDRLFATDELVDQSSSLAFKIPTFGGGERYLSPLYINEMGQPSIYIAVPIVKPREPQQLQQLTTSSVGELRRPGEVFGILKVNIALTKLWETIATVKIGENGYVFLVDDKGNIIAHPNQELARQQKNVKELSIVDLFLKSLTGRSQDQHVVQQVENENGKISLADFRVVTSTQWGVMGQIPLADVLKDTRKFIIFSFSLSLTFLAFVILTSLWLSRKIVGPIEELERVSHAIGGGNLQFRFKVSTGDEIEDLGNSFNAMAGRLEEAFYKLKQDKNIISAEKNKIAVTLANIADGVIVVDLHRRIIIFNKAAETITGFKAPEVLNKPIYDVVQLFDNDDQRLADTTFCPIRIDRVEGVVFKRENLKLVARNKKMLFVHVISAQIREGASVNLGCIVSLHDASAERQLEEMKLDFVSMAAHELRTPLTALRGYLSVFMHENQGNFTSEQNMFLTRMNISTDQLVALVENLLSVSRIEQGVFTVNIAPINWIELVEETVKGFISRAQEKKIQLVFTNPTGPISKVQADTLRITEVLSNLLSNSIAYTRPNGSITVTIEEKDDQIITHIQDTGEGIPQEALPHLFTKFFRVSGKLEQGSKGTGLGLYISQAILNMHHGRIWVESVEGKGSTFSFSLPKEKTHG